MRDVQNQGYVKTSTASKRIIDIQSLALIHNKYPYFSGSTCGRKHTCLLQVLSFDASIQFDGFKRLSKRFVLICSKVNFLRIE
jgi:hypothetical protein